MKGMDMKRSLLTGIAALAVALGMSACDRKEKKIDVPAELTDIKSPGVRVQKVWSASVGGGGKKMRFGLGLATAGDRLYAAGRDGDVAAFDLKNGRQAWRVKTKLDLTGGTGASDRIVAVGSEDGLVLALSAADGSELWRAQVGGEILSAPAVAEESVVVRTVDGTLRALAVADGKEIWSAEQQIPRLTLRGTAAPVIARDMAISGFDNGRVLAVTLNDGTTVWDTPVSPSQGRTELERLNDIDAAVKVVGEDVFVAGYQGRAAMLAIDTGQVWWTRELSSYRGVDVDDDQMYVSLANGELVALRRRTGSELWRNDALKFRSLSAPAIVGEYVVVADLDGYVHWFDRVSGTIVGRARAAGDRVTNSPLVVGNLLYVIDDRGGIAALRGEPVASRAAKAGSAESAPSPGG